MEKYVRRSLSTLVERFVGRHYLVITAVSIVVTLLAGWVLVSQWKINSDFRALLPEDAPATRALKRVEARLGSSTAMYIVIDSPSFEANRAFAEDLSERLRGMDEIVLAHFHNEKAFFERHQLLYLSATDLRELRGRIQKAIRRAKRRANPLFVPLGEEDEKPTIETDDLTEKYSGEIGRYKEYLVSDDRQSMTIVVRFSEAATQFESTERLLDRIEREVRRLGPETYHGEMAVDYGGGLVARQRQYESIMEDVGVAAVGELAILLAVIALFFRRIRAVFLVFTPLLMSVIWTLGLAFLALGELTTVSVFIFAILLGLGIDFTLHILNSYDRYRRRGNAPTRALLECYLSTGRATIVGGITTFATFVVLAFAHFRGIAQFGQIAAAGILLTLLAMLVTLPALILALDNLWSTGAHEAKQDGWFEPGWTGLSSRGAWGLLALSGLLLLGWSLVYAPTVQFEENYFAIGEIHWPWTRGDENTESGDPASGAAVEAGASAAASVRERAIAVRRETAPESYEPEKEQMSTGEKFRSAVQDQFSSTPIILLFEDPTEARRGYRTIRRLFDEGRLPDFASVSSIYSFLPAPPEAQRRRLEEIRKIRRLVERTDLSRLDEKTRRRARELLEKTRIDVVTIRDLPEWTKRFFSEAGHAPKPPTGDEELAYEYVVYVVSAVPTLKGPEARRVSAQLDLIRRRVDGAFVAASEAEAYASLLEAIKTGGVRLILIGIAVVLVILMIAFRHPLRGLIGISSLVFSGVLLFGFLGFFGIRLDVYNVVFITAIVGISVDDDIHLYRRYLEMGPGHISDAVRWVGPAVAMNALTSGIGFGGLAWTSNAGLQSVGHLAVVGVLCSLLSTVIMLPLELKVAELLGLETALKEKG